ncbi:MAG: broad specificity phosphatase PhoE [Cellvibrionaceae bacterium]|jgi:broad specificity phosphatase PhoE
MEIIRPTTIILIRHGQTDWNLQGRWQGDTDIPLNATGKAQARALAARLVSWPIENIYSSDLQRAAETSMTLADSLSLKPIFDAGWRERNLGELEGLTRKEIAEKFPHLTLPRQFVETREGETYTIFRKRVVNAFDRIMEKHEGQTTAVVSHSASLRVLISYILEIPDRIYAPFSLGGNTGLSRVVIEDGRAQLTLLNDTSHIGG